MSITQQGELVSSFAYDGCDRISKAEDVDDDGNRFAQSYQYDDADNVTEVISRSSGNEQSLQFIYNNGRLVATSNGMDYAYDSAGNMTKIDEHQSLSWDAHGRLVLAEDEDQSTLFGYGSREGIVRRVINHAGSVGVGDQSLLTLDVAATSDASHVVVRVHVDGIAVADIERTLDVMGGVQQQQQFLLFDHNSDIVASEAEPSSPLGFIRTNIESHAAPMWNDPAATVAVKPQNGKWYAPWIGRFVNPPYVVSSDAPALRVDGEEDSLARATHRRLFG
jgi:hypothetical protein